MECGGNLKQVLAIFKDRRRPVKFEQSTNALEENVNLIDAIKYSFSDLLSTESEEILRQDHPPCPSSFKLKLSNGGWWMFVDNLWCQILEQFMFRNILEVEHTEEELDQLIQSKFIGKSTHGEMLYKSTPVL